MPETPHRSRRDSTRVTLIDADERNLAVDVTRSFIVQAPAGSGKTDLLTRRFLKLLAHVDEPEEILAITFTRAATAEMRNRVLDRLKEAAAGHEAADSAMTELAAAALEHSNQRGWQLLEQPQRLNIQTIDSLCLAIAHGKPLLARLGGKLEPVENAASLYAEAARRTVERLGDGAAELRQALQAILELRDNHLGDCERLIAGMLATRDQWIRNFPMAAPGALSEEDWVGIRAQLEHPFRRAIEQGLARARELMETAGATVEDELLALATYACGNPERTIDIGLLQELRALPGSEAEHVAHWLGICELLLTRSDDWRASVNRQHGFPAGRTNSSPEAAWKRRMKALIERLQPVDGLLEALCAIRSLPPAAYQDEQWATLRQLFTVLRYAIAELKVVFAEENAVDFSELGLAAEQVLNAGGDAESDLPSETGLKRSEQYRHILVDEFQDTSRRQHELLRMLIRGWEPGDGRTAFLVGDPMQSIYIFRQAEVELFAQVQQSRVLSNDAQLRLDPLSLKMNFRSHAGLVDTLNEWFATIFANRTQGAAVPFTSSVAREEARAQPAITVHAQFLDAVYNGRAVPEDKQRAQAKEAADVLRIVRRLLPRIESTARSGKAFRVGILARAKEHVALIAERLRAAGILYRAVELEKLGERQEIVDLRSLIAALMHPMDRVAWLAVLRAPWCGLMLGDLHTLAGSDDAAYRDRPVLELLDERLELLSEDGRARAKRTAGVLRTAFESRFHLGLSFSAWVERTWLALDGDRCVDATGYENCRLFFAMLDEIAPDGIEATGTNLDERLERLFAQPDPSTTDRSGVQLMSIHKSKGLEFDVVLVPGLDKKSAANRQPLICSLERAANDGASELLVAPIGERNADADPLYKWVQRQISTREDEERKRLLYVACTRAGVELHLFGTALCRPAKQEGEGEKLVPGDSKSLLATAWPALEEEFRIQRGVVLEEKRRAAPSNLLLFPEMAPEPEGLEGILPTVAAVGQEYTGNILWRLPLDDPQAVALTNVTVMSTITAVATDEAEPSERVLGSRRSRAEGTAIHALLERLAGMLASGPAESEVRTAVDHWRDDAPLLLRECGLAPAAAEESAALVLRAVRRTAADAVGRWVLGPHKDAQSECSWSGWMDGTLRTLRVDRLFRAGYEPGQDGNDCLWIVDYKTSEHGIQGRQEFLAEQRMKYREQLESYARVARMLFPDSGTIRLGLYYPLMGAFDCWDA